MSTAVNIAGERFGRLVAFRPTDKRSSRGVIWYCLCDCGGRVEATAGALRAGKRKSCGCIPIDYEHLRDHQKIFWCYGVRAQGKDVVHVARQIFDVREVDECLSYLAGYPIEVIRAARPIDYDLLELGERDRS